MALDAPPSQNSAPSSVSTNAVAAVKALLKWKTALSATQKPQLLPGDDFIYLYLTLKKIPQKSRTNPFRIPIPHPLFDPTSEFCLIIDDRPKSNLTKESTKKIVQAQDLNVSKILRLSKLKANYKAFEEKRKLCDSYDAFFVDRRVVHLLPKLLGKSFFKSKKLPLPLDLSHKNWKEQIERVSGCGFLYMRTGSCCVMKVAKMSMDDAEIVENVVEAVHGMVKVVPKGWGGVRSLHLKFADSLALPIYQALPDVKFRIEGLRKEIESGSVDQVDVEEENRVSEKKKKNVVNKKKKGRIHEVQYMDVGPDGDEVETGNAVNVDMGEGRALELVEKDGIANCNNESDEGVKNEDDGDDESLGSIGEKRRKGKLAKGSLAKKLKSGKPGKKVKTLEGYGTRESSKDSLSAAEVEQPSGKKVKTKSRLEKQLNEGSKMKKAKRGQTAV